jgi:hypothetical protein
VEASSPTHPKSLPSLPPLVGGRAARAVEGSDRWGNGQHGVVLVFFRGPKWWRHVRCPHTEGVAVDAATTATHRWTSGARGRRFGWVWGNGRWGRPRLSGGPSAGGAFVAHTPKSSPSTPPPPPLIGGRTVCTVEGSDGCVPLPSGGRPGAGEDCRCATSWRLCFWSARRRNV